MLWNNKKITLVKTLYACYLALSFLLVVYESQWSFDGYTLGKSLGVVGLAALNMQILLSSRLHLLEKGVGLDRMFYWHRWNSTIFLTSLLVHPVLIFWPVIVSGRYWKVFSAYGIGEWLGITALSLILLTLVMTLYTKYLHLTYEQWRWIHRIGYVIIFLGFTHAFLVGSDILVRNTVFWWWILLQILLAGLLLYRFIVKPIRLRKSWYIVDKLVKEAGEVISVYFKPDAGTVRFSYAPGQMAYIRFKSAGVKDEEHHFTLSSSPLSSELSMSIKALGDFTSTLGNLKSGDRAQIEGPYGVFSNQGLNEPTVFIAGGVGITPVISMLRTMQLQKVPPANQVLLIYCNSMKAEATFAEELDEIANTCPWFRCIHVLSKAEGVAPQGTYHQRLDEHVLSTEISDPLSQWYFLVGPEPLMAMVKDILKKWGVKKERIREEKFRFK